MTEALALQPSWGALIANLDPGRQKYNDLRGVFLALARKAEAAFSVDYDEKVKNLDQVIELVPSLASPHFEAAARESLRILASHGVVDVDQDYFLTEYYQAFDTFGEAFNRIHERLLEITKTAEELDAYRIARREGRGKFIGGGFGISGAAKGIAMAGAANLAMGTAHAVFNLSAKAVSAVGDAMKKDKIFKDPQTKQSLVSALGETVLNAHAAVIEALRAQKTKVPYVWLTDDDVKKAARILNNFQQGTLGNTEPVKILNAVLGLNPYYVPAYQIALETMGDPTGDLEKVARHFHTDLAPLKEGMIAGLVRTGSIDDITASIKDLREAGQRLGYPVEAKIIPDLVARRKALEEAQRTFNGTVYETIEQAQQAQQVRLTHQKQESAKAEENHKALQSAVVTAAKWAGFFILISAMNGYGSPLILGVGLYGIYWHFYKRKPQPALPYHHYDSKVMGLPFGLVFRIVLVIVGAYGLLSGLMGTSLEVAPPAAVAAPTAAVSSGGPAPVAIPAAAAPSAPSQQGDGAMVAGAPPMPAGGSLDGAGQSSQQPAAQVAAAPTTPPQGDVPPFFGQRTANFNGKPAPELLVSINESEGTLRIEHFNEDRSTALVYQGPYSDRVMMKNGVSILFQGRQLVLLDKDGKVQRGCGSTERECISPLAQY